MLLRYAITQTVHVHVHQALDVDRRHKRKLQYLYDLLKLHEPVWTLQSSKSRLLSSSRTCTVIASRAYKHSSVIIWNNLLNSTQRVWTDAGVNTSMSVFRWLYQVKNYVSYTSYTDLSPVPVRSAVKSYFTSWLVHNLSKRVLKRLIVLTSTTCWVAVWFSCACADHLCYLVTNYNHASLFNVYPGILFLR